MDQKHVEWKWWPLDGVTPYEMNARVHAPEQVRQIAASISEFGWQHPILVDTAGVIIAGHGRVQAARSLGLALIPVVVADDLSPEKVRLLRLADNKIAENSTWDEGLLGAEFAALREIGFDLSITGFDADETDRVLNAFLNGADGEAGAAYDGHQYTKKVQAPIYEPVGPCPSVSDLVDRTKTDVLIAEINSAGLPEEIAQFLRCAADRHSVFNFASIANFYAHADAKTQDLMERSALVIIDYNKAIENGFVRLSQDIDAQFRRDYPENEHA